MGRGASFAWHNHIIVEPPTNNSSPVGLDGFDVAALGSLWISPSQSAATWAR